MVVVACFPEALTLGFLEFKGGALFQKADKFTEIRLVMYSLREDVDVIRHYAIRVKTEGMAGGRFKKKSQDALGLIPGCEMWGSAITADSDKVGLAAKIVFGGEAVVFSVKWHDEDDAKKKEQTGLKTRHYN